MKTYVIVGGVAGGAGTAARLRRLDEQAHIIMFERGEHISYANCGLPYYAGGTITERSRLFVVTAERFNEVFGVEVKTRHEVVSIHKEEQFVRVKDLQTGSEFDQYYDTLVLSPGAAPIRPRIPGIDDPAIYSLRSVSDVDAIVQKLENSQTTRAVVVGGGFIGLEMAENLKERQIKVTLVEALEQVMNVIDYDMAAIVQQHLRDKGIHLYLKDGVKSFERQKGEILVTLASGTVIATDMVILSIGVRPDTKIAHDAGLRLGTSGAISVDDQFTTSDPHIKAVGDAIEFPSPFTAKPVTVPLAGPANKQARLCAEAIVHGSCKPYTGTIATSIAKIFELTAASTGMTGKQLKMAEIPYAEVTTHAGSHAGYYPNSLQLAVKILYDPQSGTLYGGQSVGYDGVDKRIDVLAAYIKKGGTIADLTEFEQAYAPPYSSAKDPLNMVGFVAQNAMDGISRLTTWEAIEELRANQAVFLDVRTAEEFDLGAIPGAVNIPHTEIRSRLSEIPKDRPIVVYCAIGLRGYLAERMLRQHGFADIYNLTGGYRTWHAVDNERDALLHPQEAQVALFTTSVGEEDGSPRSPQSESITLVDACGLQCPGPILTMKKSMDALTRGDFLRVLATDPGFTKDVQSWARLTGNRLVSLETKDGTIEAVLEKGQGSAVGHASNTTTAPVQDGASIIVFSNDMDRVLAAFVLANGAAATGRKVTMFFTFWGLTVLRTRKTGKVKKDFMGRMFGMMLPKGMDDLSLSQINFAGMGPKLMKRRMRQKHVDQLRSMYTQARMAGVRMVACQMSMDIMGIPAVELLDGVEIGGVATYMEAASESGVNLFI
ncbi:MAG: pyridine nucleotide-disulfide oxidoreductase [Spirochaetae bacterium HGW-Spirochaetae-4]|nr:MAG: pyridine nucleotide-disulfide oxidoreductase [Spirochaetae bacterium HGW-Spirochaetae-4]